jgi:hypothetical protein
MRLSLTTVIFKTTLLSVLKKKLNQHHVQKKLFFDINPLEFNSVFVIMLYFITIKPFICFQKYKKVHRLSKSNFIKEVFVTVLKTNSINSRNQ